MIALTMILTASLLGAPGVFIVDANTSEINLVGWAGYEYNVYISHDSEQCLYWPPHAIKVLTDTQFHYMSFDWNDYKLDTPQAGDEACIWWDAQPEPAIIYFGINRKNIKQILYLPTVIKDV